MASSSSIILAIHASLLSITLLASLSRSSFFAQSLCHHNEGVALLQFKPNLLISNFVSSDPSSYPKTASWGNHNGSTDCCLWNGVECNEVSGYVIGLDLSSSYIYGSIDSGSSLFNLVHLQYLNLGDNHFNFSRIPSEIGLRLTRLTYLNLSQSAFFGEIPPEIAQLSSLRFLDLGGNFDYEPESYTQKRLLKLDAFVLKRLFRRSRGLKLLDLSLVQLLSTLPDSIGNLSSLSYLNLVGCELSGPIPSSLGDLRNLGYLYLAKNNLSGQIPSSLTNLTQLIELSLGANNFIPGELSWLGKQNKLKWLNFEDANLVGEIPVSFGNLTHLRYLYLSFNNLLGDLEKVTSCLLNVSQLIKVELDSNQLHGRIPESITKISKLELLVLSSNHLSGIVEVDMFSRFKHLYGLMLQGNNLSVIDSKNASHHLPKFQYLGLGSCDLKKFPEFLRHQDRLVYLNVVGNELRGQIPSWIVNMSTETLLILKLSNNFLTGFEQPYLLFNLSSLGVVYLNDNELEGPPPITSSSVFCYVANNNFLSGEIPHSFCNLHSAVIIDLSHNNLIRKIPQCLGNFSVSLQALSLSSNSLSGSIPSKFTNKSMLKMIDLGNNRLEGRLPRSLANCTWLEKLDVSENNITDEFPSWLGTLRNLKVLILRSNQFFGSITTPAMIFYFPSLQILDLSSNHFTGILPFEFFQGLRKMMSTKNQFAYLMARQERQLAHSAEGMQIRYDYVMALRNKGLKRKYEKIPNVIAAVDLSNNEFQGEIPQSLADLTMVNVLDLSNNNLSGDIPPALVNMTRLESLDLSLNNFSGEIPPQLIKLTFLAYFNVSRNQLEGEIPHGNQFDTFDNTSYMGNPRLCGDPLSKKCHISKPIYPPQINEDSTSSLEFGWKVVVFGYGTGLIVGVALGYLFSIWKHSWLMKTFRIKEPTKA